MINADEAKKMSQDGANSYSRFWIEKNIKEIEERIMRAAKRGDRAINVTTSEMNHDVCEIIRDFFKSKGYHFSFSNKTFTISW